MNTTTTAKTTPAKTLSQIADLLAAGKISAAGDLCRSLGRTGLLGLMQVDILGRGVPAHNRTGEGQTRLITARGFVDGMIDRVK